MLDFFNKRIFIIFIFPLVLGGITVLGFQPFNLFFVNFLSLPLLFFIIIYVKKKSKSTYRKKPFIKNLFVLGSSFGFGFFFCGIFWIANSLTFDPIFKILIPFSLFLIPLFLSLFFSIPIVLIGNFCEKNLSSIILISLAFSFSDFTRSKILTGFPWNIWSYSFSWSIEILQILKIIGIFSFNFFAILIFFLQALIFFKNKLKYYLIPIFIVMTFSNYFYGSYNVNSPKQYPSEKINFKIVSAKVDMTSFKDEESVASKLIKYSEPNKSVKTIFIWPEGVFVDENFYKNKKIKELFKKNFSENHLIIFGANTSKKVLSQHKYFNSMLVSNNNLQFLSKYNKRKLVPFGEFLPFEFILNSLGLKKITTGHVSFSSGKNDSSLEFEYNKKKINILPLICYEIIFPDLVEENNEYNFLINISEDAWFGKSIGPHQHFAKAIFRSIESNVFTLRAANMGVSAFISPEGKILKNLQPNEIGNIELSLPILKNNKKQIKKDLIFLSVLITFIILFLILRKFKI